MTVEPQVRNEPYVIPKDLVRDLEKAFSETARDIKEGPFYWFGNKGVESKTEDEDTCNRSKNLSLIVPNIYGRREIVAFLALSEKKDLGESIGTEVIGCIYGKGKPIDTLRRRLQDRILHKHPNVFYEIQDLTTR
jgi:hypothetical protein